MAKRETAGEKQRAGGEKGSRVVVRVYNRGRMVLIGGAKAGASTSVTRSMNSRRRKHTSIPTSPAGAPSPPPIIAIPSPASISSCSTTPAHPPPPPHAARATFAASDALAAVTAAARIEQPSGAVAASRGPNAASTAPPPPPPSPPPAAGWRPPKSGRGVAPMRAARERKAARESSAVAPAGGTLEGVAPGGSGTSLSHCGFAGKFI
jgi:hypothetical protein